MRSLRLAAAAGKHEAVGWRMRATCLWRLSGLVDAVLRKHGLRAMNDHSDAPPSASQFLRIQYTG
jgi:hypothetical protein